MLVLSIISMHFVCTYSCRYRRWQIRCTRRWETGLSYHTSRNVIGYYILQHGKMLIIFYHYSVNHLAQILKQAIENEQPILQEIKMPCKELQIDMVSYEDSLVNYIYVVLTVSFTDGATPSPKTRHSS